MQIFSPALKRQMKDCILAIFWPRKEILAFFRDCSVPIQVLKSIKDWERLDTSRSEMIDRVFEHLGAQPDSGTLHFKLMLDELAEWSHFSDYWFVTQARLDRQEAERAILRLRKARDKIPEKSRTQVEEYRKKEQERLERFENLKEMQDAFNCLSRGTASEQERGYAFENFLAKLVRYYGLTMSHPFRVRGTQIDGTIKFDGENYSIEAKWHNRYLSDEPLFAFCGKIETNMHGRGIYISINGYTEGAIELLERSKIKNLILMDGEDIALILSEMITLPEVLDAKVQAAQTRGQFYVHPITRENKIKYHGKRKT